jgi:hypothetical protein
MATLETASKTMVVRRCGSYGAQPGLPVLAKRTQAPLTASATFCWSAPVPTIEADLATLSKTKACSTECGDFHLPPSTGVSQANRYMNAGAPPWAALRSACRMARERKRASLVAVK